MRKIWASLPALLAGVLLAACQPPLNTSLPQGTAAYDALDVPQEVALAAGTLLEPGDQIAIVVFQEEELSTPEQVVDEAGNASLPLIGEIRAAGLSPAQLASEIERAYGARYLRNPNVNVYLTEGAPRIVSVEGEVADPGVYPVQQGYTLLTAVAMAGSPTATAKLDQVLVFRTLDGQRMGGRFDLTAIRAGRMDDPVILPNDVVVVGFSTLRGVYQDFLRSAPILGAFARF